MIGAVEPQHVAVDDKKPLVQQRQRPRHPAAGFEQLVLLRQLDARMLARGEPGFDHFRLVVDVDDDPLDPDQRQPIDRVVEQACGRRFRRAALARCR